MPNSLAIIAAKRVLDSCGIENPTGTLLQTIVRSKGIVLKEEEIDGSEGRIVFGSGIGVITVDSKINLVTKKRFIIAHELGHYELHRRKQGIFNDTEETLSDWYNYSVQSEEIEANEFAAEFLMPAELFLKECKNKSRDKSKIREYGIDLSETIDHVASTFEVSAMAALLRFATTGNHPAIVVYSKNAIIRWFQPSPAFPHRLLDTKIKVRPESVAYEAFSTGKTYTGIDRKQRIPKSAWFVTNEKDQDDEFFEYCIYVPSYGYCISIIWEK